MYRTDECEIASWLNWHKHSLYIINKCINNLVQYYIKMDDTKIANANGQLNSMHNALSWLSKNETKTNWNETKWKHWSFEDESEHMVCLKHGKEINFLCIVLMMMIMEIRSYSFFFFLISFLVHSIILNIIWFVLKFIWHCILVVNTII